MKHAYQPEGAHCPQYPSKRCLSPYHKYSLTGFHFVGASCLKGVAASPNTPAHRSRHTAAPTIHPTSSSNSNRSVDKQRHKWYTTKNSNRLFGKN